LPLVDFPNVGFTLSSYLLPNFYFLTTSYLLRRFFIGLPPDPRVFCYLLLVEGVFCSGHY
jgi:hypothetical protein